MKTSLPKVEEFRATEIIDLQEAEFSEEAGKMRAKIRIIKAGVSKNNRNYRAAAIKEAVEKKMFDGIRMFVNHNKDGSPLKRNLREMVSAVESTEWNEEAQAMDGWVNFFDKDFYDYASRAKNYMGTSINALVRGTRIPQATGRALEDISGFHQPRSVDWVIYPAAGGEILAFEDEDEDMLDWSKVTPEQLKANRAEVYEAIKAEAAAELKAAQEAENGDDKPEAITVTQEDINRMIAEGISQHSREQAAAKARQESAAAQLREAMGKSGLPEKTRARVMASFEGIEEYKEDVVAKAIQSAKEELAAVGAGPHITDMGPSGEGTTTPRAFSVKESVEGHFNVKKTDPAKSDDSAGKGS